MSFLNYLINIPPVDLIYFCYGTTFFFLGAFIAAKNMEASNLKLAGRLWLLGAFGFAHGIHEWLKLYALIEGEHFLPEELFAVKAITAFAGALSFIFLLLFGYSLVRAVNVRMRWVRFLPAALFLLWIGYVWNYGFRPDFQFLRRVEMGGRYTFGFSGSLLAAYGLIAYASEVRHLGHFISDKLFFAGVSFIFYSIFMGLFPSDIPVPLIHVPIEVFRSLSAIGITCFIIRALNIFDIETRKKIEEQTRLLAQSEKLSSLGQLAAGIAHEINTPLTNASLGIQTLKVRLGREGSGGDLVEKLSAVERNIDRASVIAQELLQFSRPRSTDLIPVNINTIIRGSLTLLQYRLKGIVIELDLGDPAEVMGDPGKLEQVFINILSNSAEAMPSGGKIAIATLQHDASVIIRITDTGVGITGEHLSKVFDPFFSTKEIGMGTGLGLSISYGIIRQHHGSIMVASNVGSGTTITIEIPTRERYEKNIDHR